jgi:hypothetical protein
VSITSDALSESCSFSQDSYFDNYIRTSEIGIQLAENPSLVDWRFAQLVYKNRYNRYLKDRQKALDSIQRNKERSQEELVKEYLEKRKPIPNNKQRCGKCRQRGHNKRSCSS